MADVEPAECFVGMFDILGFKTLREAQGTAGLHRLYTQAILAGVRHSAAGNGRLENDRWVPNFASPLVDHRVFSDTVVFWTKGASADDLHRIVKASIHLMAYGFMGTKAPFRGAIGFGDLIAGHGTELLIGSALEDAHAVEQDQAWAGCILTPACEERAVAVNVRSAEHPLSLVVRYDAPIQTRDGPSRTYTSRPAYVLNWTLKMYENAAAASFYPTKNPHAQQMIDNTVTFETWARARRPKDLDGP